MKKIYLSIICLSFTGLSFGQTLQSTDINATVGESFPYNQTDYLSPGASGTGQTWDLSGLSTVASSTINHLAANASYPNSNITQQDVTAGSEIYWEFSNTEQVIHAIDAGGTIIDYSNPQTHIGFPLSMGATGNDTHDATFTSGGFPFTRSGTTSWEVDGSGTVITPNGTYTNVLRVHLTQIYTDTYSLGTIDYDVQIYAWYKAGIHHPVASLTSYTTTQGNNQYGLYLTGNVGLEENNAVVFNMFPNPASNTFEITTGNNDFKSAVITDLSGQIIKEVTTPIVDISELESGIYLVQTTTTDGNISVAKKLVKQ